ncbi:Prolyl 4-hydroxylase, alpha subunit [Cordyceps militaris CM01]|uniref:Prolyl 4-hydroxylase, alpha subunit n=1 Tax=Cordyceps militaris (strain CM01) TaxID=983644 RepID=G3J9R8_CORMM|nr:Prolyl 4-hydroxylase, alpha subunit [Cordyceps militaris CM01]EGX94991.1 Prolyl 4-hydroxylase, alpha subunit [Cordyceps militaris CM01]
MGKSKAAKPSKAQHPAAPPPPPPAWPPFKPPLPVVDLLPTPHPRSAKVVTLDGFFPRSLCRAYVSFLSTLALQTTPGTPRRGDAVRVNDRLQVRDAAFADALWARTGLREALLRDDVVHLWGGEPVGLSPNIRVYRYTKGQFFDCHYDESNNVTLEVDATPVLARTTWTLLLYLTSAAEGCVGGETVFYPHDRPVDAEAISVAPQTGTLLLHKHGDDCLLHEGREVRAGEKWVLRTDLCIKR